MHNDKFGQLIFQEKDLVDLYLKDPTINLHNVLVDFPVNFSNDLNIEDIPGLHTYIEPDKTIQDFDTNNQNTWFMPEEYMNLDIAQYVLDQCKNDAELQRAGQELLMYQERDMFDLLRYLKYLVDTFRTNKLVWGVGRGSSVASFVLFLIGVHKINSLYYDLSIEEFLK